MGVGYQYTKKAAAGAPAAPFAKFFSGGVLRSGSAAATTAATTPARRCRCRVTRHADRGFCRLRRTACGRRPTVVRRTVLNKASVRAQDVAGQILRTGGAVELACFQRRVVDLDHQVFIPVVVLVVAGEPRQV